MHKSQALFLMVIISLLMIYPMGIHAQSPVVPDFRCIAVEGDSVKLYWKPYDTTLFDVYHIFYSYDLIRFDKLSFNVQNTDSVYAYREINFTQPIYYYMTTINSQGESDESDTLASIKLLIDNTIPGVAELSWNTVHSPQNNDFKIWRKAQGESWTEVASQWENSYYDTISHPYCSDTTLYYQIWMADPSFECKSVSTTANAILGDATDPPMVEMDTLTVDIRGNVSIEWFPLVLNDLKGYIVYRQEPSGFQPIATVPPGQTSYTDMDANAAQQAVSYRIGAIDSCDNEGLGGFNFPLTTIFLDSIAFDYCDISISLNWNDSNILYPDPVSYEIYQLDTLSGESNLIGSSTINSFTYTAPFEADSSYCFFIRALNEEAKSTTSCLRCFTANRPLQPDTLYLKTASYDNMSKKNLLSFLVDTAAYLSSCIVLRQEDGSNTTDTLAVIPVGTDPLLSLTDEEALPGEKAYLYRLLILDECLNKCWLPDNRARTILLQGDAPESTINTLNWSACESSVNELQAYLLHRYINGEHNKSFRLDTNTLSYSDNVSAFASSGGIFSYQLEALMLPEGQTQADTLSVFSNPVIVSQLSGIYFPNAFTPNGDGINDTFGPVNYFADIRAEYSLAIYNRFGEMIWESKDPSQGWDGDIDGKAAPPGVYVFRMSYFSEESGNFSRKALFTLLR